MDVVPRFNLRQLGTFKTVVEAGSLREAARRLGVTQPAITHAMRELEQALGANLFTRSIWGVQLTPVGQAFWDRARRLLDDAQNAQQEVEQLVGIKGGRVRIATSAALAQLKLVQTMQRFRQACPGVQLELREVNWFTAADGWRDGEYDLMVLAEAEGRPIEGLDRQWLANVPTRVYVRDGHPLGQARSIGELAGQTWLMPGYGMDALASLFERSGQAPPQEVIHCYSLAIAMALVRQSDTVAVFSGLLADDQAASQGLRPVEIVESLPTVSIAAVTRDRRTLTPAARTFLELLQASVTSVGSPADGAIRR